MPQTLRPEQPREKVKRQGIDSLNNIEIVALLLRTGNKQESVIQLAQRLLDQINGIQNMTHLTYYELVKVKGIKQAKAITILAAIHIKAILSFLRDTQYEHGICFPASF